MEANWQQPFREFEGQHVIIAGASSGSIGATLVNAMSSLGAILTVIDIAKLTVDEILLSAPSNASAISFIQADLTKEVSRQSALRQAIGTAGPPAYFVSAIGKDDRVGFDVLSQQTMQSLQEVNFLAPFWTAKELLEPMREGGGGSMLLLTSHHADQITEPEMVSYSTAKAQLNKGIEHLAVAAGRKNTLSNIIRVNGFCPGWVWTPNQTRRFDAADQDAALSQQAIPLAMDPAGLIGSILSILSNRLSPYITGAIMHADGGRRY